MTCERESYKAEFCQRLYCVKGVKYFDKKALSDENRNGNTGIVEERMKGTKASHSTIGDLENRMSVREIQL